jgi:acyl-CoA synthetase (AMP-forming)/AMP-acid ligase II
MPATDAHAMLDAVFEGNASRRFLAAADGRELSYGEFYDIAGNIGRRLVARGLKPGSRLMIRLENSEHVLALYLACALAGVVACPLDPLMPAQRAAALITRFSPALLIDSGVLEELLAPGAPADARLPTASEDADFLVVFSSGSTGEPKGIVHSLRSMTQSAASFAALSGLNADSVVYHHFPMFYMAGIFNQFFCPLMAGGTIVIGPKFSKAQMLRFWEAPMRCGVNCLTLTPTMALSLAQLYRRDARLLEHLSRYQGVVATGGPLYRSIAERFLETFKVPLRACYGVTEVGGSITYQSWEDALVAQSVGSAAAETEIRAGSAQAPAEILVRTPFMAKGYLAQEGLADCCDAEGFFHTGDIGYLRDSLLYFAGRENDLIKKGGEFVSTQLVEDLGLRNTQVTDVAAVGVADEFWGARLVLFYVPQRDAAEPQILAQFDRLFADGLRPIERPDKFIPVPWMPKTSIGKIVKRDLVDKYTLGNGAPA